MAVVKEDPLPPGRYWKVLLPQGSGVPWDGPTVFAAWMKIFGPPDTYAVLDHVEAFEDGREFVIFRTLKPTPWGIADKIGWPDHAPPSVQSYQDVSDVKPTPGPFDPGGTFDKDEDGFSMPWWGYAVIGSVALISIGYAVRSVR